MDGGGLRWCADERGGAQVLAPSGRIDESTATEFNDRLGEAAAAGGTLVLDLEGIAYMSSRGLRALTLAQRRGSQAGTTIVLARPNETMREILAISRYDMVFRIVETVEDAFDG
jgi:anti-sigma B factor antagonist